MINLSNGIKKKNKPTTFIDRGVSQKDSKPYVESQKKTELKYRTEILEQHLAPEPSQK